MALSSFEKAFAAARKAGKKAFDWNGKSFNTKLANPLKTSSPPMPRSKTTAKPDTSGVAAPKPPSGAPKASVYSSQNSDFDSRQKARAADKAAKEVARKKKLVDSFKK